MPSESILSYLLALKMQFNLSAYLRLRERKVILRHLDKCAKIFDKANLDPSVKLPDKMEEVFIELIFHQIELSC